PSSLSEEAAEPHEWFSAVRSALDAAIRRGAVGVKTICAYRATLRLEPVDTDALGVAFSATRLRAERGEHPRLSGSALCHALLFEAAQACREHRRARRGKAGCRNDAGVQRARRGEG